MNLEESLELKLKESACKSGMSPITVNLEFQSFFFSLGTYNCFFIVLSLFIYVLYSSCYRNMINIRFILYWGLFYVNIMYTIAIKELE